MSSNEHGRVPRINPPETVRIDSAEYLRECAFAVEPSLISLVETAAEAGWRKREILLAIMIATEDYFRNSGMEFDPEELHFVGPSEFDTLN